MSQYKICNGCGAENAQDEAFCSECFGTDFEILEEVSNEQGEIKITNSKNSSSEVKESDKTTIDTSAGELQLISADLKQTIYHNDIIGRGAVGAEYLAEIKTISRKHSKFYFEEGKWHIEDLGSTNGTYVNNDKIPSREKVKIGDGDSLKFSSKFSIRVSIENSNS